jgi:hypothetical protein
MVVSSWAKEQINEEDIYFVHYGFSLYLRSCRREETHKGCRYGCPDRRYTNAKGTILKLPTVQTISPDLEVVLGVFKPILTAAMGNLGNNFHFKVHARLRINNIYHKGTKAAKESAWAESPSYAALIGRKVFSVLRPWAPGGGFGIAGDSPDGIMAVERVKMCHPSASKR